MVLKTLQMMETTAKQSAPSGGQTAKAIVNGEARALGWEIVNGEGGRGHWEIWKSLEGVDDLPYLLDLGENEEEDEDGPSSSSMKQGLLELVMGSIFDIVLPYLQVRPTYHLL